MECRYNGGMLAVVYSSKINAALTAHFGKLSTTFWIGVSSEDGLTDWKTVTGQSVPAKNGNPVPGGLPSYWYAGEPNSGKFSIHKTNMACVAGSSINCHYIFLILVFQPLKGVFQLTRLDLDGMTMDATNCMLSFAKTRFCLAAPLCKTVTPRFNKSKGTKYSFLYRKGFFTLKLSTQELRKSSLVRELC
jgi:hypothetical protein